MANEHEIDQNGTETRRTIFRTRNFRNQQSITSDHLL